MCDRTHECTITSAIEQVLTKDKWKKDKDFPQLQQAGRTSLLPSWRSYEPHTSTIL
jgi:hypothetical protein